MDVFDLAAKLTLDTSEYEKGLNGAASASGSFGKVAGGIGATAAGVATTIAAVGTAAVSAGKAIYENVAAVAASGDEIDKQAQKLSISAEMYQKLSYACDLSGASIDNLKRGIVNITDDLAAVAAGGDEADTKFAALGVSAYDASGQIKDSEAVMYEALLALADMSDETERNAAANEIFGKSYTELLPLLNSGSEGIAAMMQEAEDFGMVMSDDTVKAAAGFQDALTQLSGTFNGVKNDLLSDFLPSITTVMDGFSDLLAGNEGAGEKISAGFIEAIDNVQELLPRIFEIVENIVPAVMEVAPKLVEALVSGIVTTLPKLIPAATQMITSLVSTILGLLPQILDAGIQIILSLVNGISQMLPTLIPEVVQTIVDLITTLLDNADLVLDAAIGLIKGLVEGILSALPILIQALPKIFTSVIKFILSAIPQLINAVIDIVMAIVEALPDIIAGLVEAIPEIISGIITAILDAIPLFIEAFIRLFLSLVDAIPDIITGIIAVIPDIIIGIIGAIVDAIPQLIETGISLFMSLISALPKIIIGIVSAIPQIISQIVVAIITLIPQLIDTGILLFLSLIEELPYIISQIVQIIPTLIKAIVDALIENFPQMVQSGKDLVLQLIEGLIHRDSLGKVGDKVMEIGGKIKDGFLEFIHKAPEWGKDLIENFVNGVKNKIQLVKDTVSNVAQTVQDFLGFSEPDKGPLSDFHTYAPDMIDLFTKGIYDGRNEITDAISDVFDVQSAISDGFSVDLASRGTQQIENNVTVTLEGDMAELFRAFVRENNDYKNSNGRSAFA